MQNTDWCCKISWLCQTISAKSFQDHKSLLSIHTSLLAKVHFHNVAGPSSRPRSSIWVHAPPANQQVQDPDEQPVTYRVPSAPLRALAQSARAPWLHTAAVTAAKFKQPPRALHTERRAEQRWSQVQASFLAKQRCDWWFCAIVAHIPRTAISMHVDSPSLRSSGAAMAWE